MPSYQWSELTQSAQFIGRDGAGMLALNDKLWLLGGWRWQTNGGGPDFAPTGALGCCTTSEVWNSSDGADWQLVTVAPWGPRHMAGWTVFDNQLWVVGGDDNTGSYDTDVWSSPDGVIWTQVATTVPWAPRVLHHVEAFNGYLYVMGGQQLPALLDPLPNPYPAAPVVYADVWRSADGVNWEQIGEMPFALGMIVGSAVFNGEMWVIGGGTYGDDTQMVSGEAYAEVWSTLDGTTWTQHATAPWPVRRYHNLAVFDSKLWVLAGIGPDGSSDKNDVWYSADGDTWTQVPGTPWATRHAASVATLNGALYLTGGTDDAQVQHSDVWKLEAH